MSSKERATPINGTQKSILTEWMKSHPELISGLFTNNFTKKDAKALWESVTNTLNAVAGGSKKEWMQWRKTWQDLKKNTKTKNSQIKKHEQGTGGGPPSDIKWTAADAEILALQNPTSLIGDDKIPESVFVFDFGPQTEPEGNNNITTDKYNEENYKNFVENIEVDHDEEIEEVIPNTLVAKPLAPPSPLIQVQQIQKPVVSNKRPHNLTESKAENLNKGQESKASTTKPPITKKKFTTKSSRFDKSLTLTNELVFNQRSQKQMQNRYNRTKLSLLKKDCDSKILFRNAMIKCKKQQNCQLRKISNTLNDISKKFSFEKSVSSSDEEA